MAQAKATAKPKGPRGRPTLYTDAPDAALTQKRHAHGPQSRGRSPPLNR